MERKNEAIWIEARQRWQINVQKDGERRTFCSSTIGPKGKIAAEKRADKWLETNEQKDIRFGVLWEQFLAETKEVTSIANYKKHQSIGKTYLLPIMKNKRLSTITPQHWQSCVNQGYKNGLSKKSLQHIRGSATAFYRYAKKGRYPLQRPEDLTIPRNARVSEKNILQPEDIKKLFSQDTIFIKAKEQRAFFIHAWRFLVLTGLRPGELVGLKNTDIKGNYLTVMRALNTLGEETRGKNTNARRTMLLNSRAIKILEDQKAMLKNAGIISPWVFPQKNGACVRPYALYNHWRRYREQHNIACTLYEMRHTMISIVKNDLPDSLLKRIVGHSKSMDTLGQYGHNVDGELEMAAELLDVAFNRVFE